jgi:hypothetical protein
VSLADGRDLGEVLVGEGDAFASPMTAQDPGYADALRQAQDAAVAARVGVWAPGVCTPAPGKPPAADAGARSAWVSYLTGAGTALQQANLGVNVLGEQGRSAARLVGSPAWEHTTAGAVGWLDGAAQTLQTEAGDGPPAHPVGAELVQLGADLKAQTDAYAQAAATGDAAQVEAAAEQLAATGAVIPRAAAEVMALQGAYGVGD